MLLILIAVGVSIAAIVCCYVGDVYEGGEDE